MATGLVALGTALGASATTAGAVGVAAAGTIASVGIAAGSAVAESRSAKKARSLLGGKDLPDIKNLKRSSDLPTQDKAQLTRARDAKRKSLLTGGRSGTKLTGPKLGTPTTISKTKLGQ